MPEATGPEPILNVKGGVPPEAEMVADPVVAPLQSASVVASNAPTTGVGSAMVTLTEVGQLLSSKIFTV